MSRSIGEPLTYDTTDRTFGALNIINAEPGPVVVAEIEFCEIAMQVLLTNVLVGSINAALEDREKVFCGVGRCIAANLFLLGVSDGAVTGKLFSRFPIDAALIGAQVRSLVDAGFQAGPEVSGIHFRDMLRADATLALDQGDNSLLWRRMPIGAVASVSADEGFVRLDKHAFAAERSLRRNVDHCFADSVPDEPAGFEVDAKDSTELICAETLLRRAQKVHGLEPDMHRDMALLENGSDLNGERLPAGVALIDADPSAFAAQLTAVIDDSAVRTYTAIRPNHRLNIGISGFFVPEAWFVKNGARHLLSPSQRIYNA